MYQSRTYRVAWRHHKFDTNVNEIYASVSNQYWTRCWCEGTTRLTPTWKKSSSVSSTNLEHTVKAPYALYQRWKSLPQCLEPILNTLLTWRQQTSDTNVDEVYLNQSWTHCWCDGTRRLIPTSKKSLHVCWTNLEHLLQLALILKPAAMRATCLGALTSDDHTVQSPLCYLLVFIFLKLSYVLIISYYRSVFFNLYHSFFVSIHPVLRFNFLPFICLLRM